MTNVKDKRVSGKQHGFTLIELLVVIAIIALLLAILMPALNEAKNRARALQCLNHIRILGQANMMYVADNDDRTVPLGWILNPAFLSLMGLDNSTIQECLNPDNVPNPDPWISWFSAPLPRKYICPVSDVARRGAKFSPSMAGTYGINVGAKPMSPDPYGWHSYVDKPGMRANNYRYSEIRMPAEKLMFTESSDNCLTSSNQTYGDANTGINPKYWRDFGDNPPFWGTVSYRHNVAASVVYYDISAALVRSDKLYFEVNGSSDNGVMGSIWALH